MRCKSATDIVEVGVGDRIITRNNDFKIRTTSNTAIVNGWAWTVKSIEDNGDLRLSAVGRGGDVVLPADYIARDGSIQLGWASTVHVAQGRTADVGMTLIDDSTDLELLYVGATRGSRTNLIFGLGTEHEALEAAKAAARKVRAKISATEAKDLATDRLEDPPGRKPVPRSPRPPAIVAHVRYINQHSPDVVQPHPALRPEQPAWTIAPYPHGGTPFPHEPIQPRRPPSRPSTPNEDEQLAQLATDENLVSLADNNSAPLDAPHRQQPQRRLLHTTSQPPKPRQPRAFQRPHEPSAQLQVSHRPPKPPPHTVMEFVRRAKAELTDVAKAHVDKALATIAGNPDAPDVIAAQWAALDALNESVADRRLTHTEHPRELSSPEHPAQGSQAIGLH